MKYCDYCDPNYGDDLSDMTAQIQKYGDTYGFCMRVNGVDYAVAIDFCPMCGRKLTEEE